MRVWKKHIDVEELTQSHIDTAVEHLGMEFLEVGDDFIRARVPVPARSLFQYTSSPAVHAVEHARQHEHQVADRRLRYWRGVSLSASAAPSATTARSARRPRCGTHGPARRRGCRRAG
jgi:hypothetical protein